MTKDFSIPASISAALTPEQFIRLGAGEVAYVRPIASQDASRIFPLAGEIPPGVQLFALLNADGSPILLSDSLPVALANAREQELTAVPLQ